MEKEKFDSLMKETLESKADRVTMSSSLQEEIKQKVRSNGTEEAGKMRRLSTKKVVLAAAAMCVLMSVVAVAGGKAAGWVSGSNPNRPEIKTYQDIKAADSYMGSEIKSVEKFTNGYQFKQGHLMEVEEIDENNQKIGSFHEAMLYYQKGEKRITLSVIPLGKDEGTVKHAVSEAVSYEGITLQYSKDFYKFVPADYEVTDEEQAAMDSGELYVSYGSDEVEMKVYQSVAWDDESAHYLITGFGTDLDMETLVQMAKEVIGEKQ